MVSNATIICVFISLLISVGLPLAVLAVYAGQNRKQGILSAWLLGAAGFFVTQILIRVPILTALQTNNAFIRFSQEHAFAYVFSLAFTAGLFELAGRFAVAKLLVRKGLNFKRSLAAGLGHGGIEAIVLIGSAMVSNLAMIAMLNTGSFDAMVAETAAMGADVSQLEMIKQQLVTYSPAMFLLSGFERILTMTAHAAMSMLVCYGVAFKKGLPCTLLCLLLHTFIDLSAGLTLVLPQAVAYTVIYSILTVVAALSVLVIRRIHRSWKEVPYEK